MRLECLMATNVCFFLPRVSSSLGRQSCMTIGLDMRLDCLMAITILASEPKITRNVSRHLHSAWEGSGRSARAKETGNNRRLAFLDCTRRNAQLSCASWRISMLQRYKELMMNLFKRQGAFEQRFYRSIRRRALQRPGCKATVSK